MVLFDFIAADVELIHSHGAATLLYAAIAAMLAMHTGSDQARMVRRAESPKLRLILLFGLPLNDEVLCERHLELELEVFEAGARGLRPIRGRNGLFSHTAIDIAIGLLKDGRVI